MTLTNLKRFMSVALTTLLLSLQTMGNGVYASGLEAKDNEDKEDESSSEEDEKAVILKTTVDLAFGVFKDPNFLEIVAKLKESNYINNVVKKVKNLEKIKADLKSTGNMPNSSNSNRSDESSDEDDDKPEDKSVSTKGDSTDNGGASSLNDSNSLEQQRKKFANLFFNSNTVSNTVEAFSSNEDLKKDRNSYFLEFAKNSGITEEDFEEPFNNLVKCVGNPAIVYVLRNMADKVISDKNVFEDILNVTTNLSESK
ncbi:MAG: hypothetical protein LBB13_02200 [Rickettsiales bacterium]|jgi:hypothetical protein|nr:hypothetical protein [Rickettsiales bacterium]